MIDHHLHIAGLRQRIAEAIAAREAIRQAPPPPREAETALEIRVRAAGERATASLTTGTYPEGLAGLMQSDPVGLWCLLAPAAVLAAGISVQRREAASLGKPLSEAARAAELARIDAAIGALELDEERAIRAAERDGLEVDRRIDADPRAILATLEIA